MILSLRERCPKDREGLVNQKQLVLKLKNNE
jgi:hypothetical protein